MHTYIHTYIHTYVHVEQKNWVHTTLAFLLHVPLCWKEECCNEHNCETFFKFVWFLNGLLIIPLTNIDKMCLKKHFPHWAPITYLSIYLKKVVSSVAILTTYLPTNNSLVNPFFTYILTIYLHTSTYPIAPPTTVFSNIGYLNYF